MSHRLRMETKIYVAAITLAIFASLGGAQSVVNDKLCPSVCMCDNVERYVICEEKKLSHVPLPLPEGTKLLGLSKNQIRQLNPSTFAKSGIGSSLESLVLYDNRITDIVPSAFVSFTKLKYLWLFGNRLTSLRRNSFSQLASAVELDLSRNQLTNIESGAFAGLNSLRILQLWGNKLETLDPGALDGMPALRNLTLGDNKFEEIPTAAFQHLNNLTSIELLNLPISVVRNDAFKPLTNLHWLHIGDWPLLQSIDDNAFRGLQKLEYISLHGCNLNEVPHSALTHVPNLKYLMLSNNENIKHLKAGDFLFGKNLESLYLSKTGIHTIQESPFRLLTKLKELDLSQNKITTLPNHVFLQLENLRALNLSYNNIKALSSSAFLALNLLNEVDLLQNPLICDCDIKWLKALQEMKIREHFRLSGKCSDPLLLNGTDIVALSASRFICEKPSFQKGQENVTVVVQVGKASWLPCMPKHGVPTPVIQWIGPNMIKTEKNFHIQQLANGTLRIGSVKSTDYGHYLCTATNRLGEANRTVILLEHFPPDEGQASGTTAAIIVTLIAITAIIVIIVVIYKKRSYKTFRNGLYDVMIGDNESQHLPVHKPKSR